MAISVSGDRTEILDRSALKLGLGSVHYVVPTSLVCALARGRSPMSQRTRSSAAMSRPARHRDQEALELEMLRRLQPAFVPDPDLDRVCKGGATVMISAAVMNRSCLDRCLRKPADRLLSGSGTCAGSSSWDMARRLSHLHGSRAAGLRLDVRVGAFTGVQRPAITSSAEATQEASV